VNNPVISPIVEDYLKAIFYLQEEHEVVTTSALAERLKVAAPSVTGMLQKLAQQKPRLVHYERHKGVTLAATGRKIALEIIRHHRLIELYLAAELDYGWDEVHAEAEKLEHVISEEFEDKIAERLGGPLLDPHGDPIPTKEGSVLAPSRLTLSDLGVGQMARIARVRNEDATFLRYLTELGVSLHIPVVVTHKAPFEGPLQVTIGEQSHAISKLTADSIFVEVKDPA
jgi:DtxR family transcriptional regulator, Mn-dependent transcriptional regulator